MSGEGDGEDGEEELLAVTEDVDGGEDGSVSSSVDGGFNGDLDSNDEEGMDGAVDDTHGNLADGSEGSDERLLELVRRIGDQLIVWVGEQDDSVELVRRLGEQLLDWVEAKEEAEVVNGFWNTARFQ